MWMSALNLCTISLCLFSYPHNVLTVLWMYTSNENQNSIKIVLLNRYNIRVHAPTGPVAVQQNYPEIERDKKYQTGFKMKTGLVVMGEGIAGWLNT